MMAELMQRTGMAWLAALLRPIASAGVIGLSVLYRPRAKVPSDDRHAARPTTRFSISVFSDPWGCRSRVSPDVVGHQWCSIRGYGSAREPGQRCGRFGFMVPRVRGWLANRQKSASLRPGACLSGPTWTVKLRSSRALGLAAALTGTAHDRRLGLWRRLRSTSSVPALIRWRP